MASESEGVQQAHYIVNVILIVIVQHPDQLSLHLALLVQLLVVFQSLQGHKLLLFMVEAAQHDTEGTGTQLFDNLVAVAEMLIESNYVLFLIVVEATISIG